MNQYTAYKVDRNIPLPKVKNGSRYNFWVDIVDKMNLGDSILFRDKKAASCLITVLCRKKFGFAQTTTDKGIRIWKTKRRKK